MKLRIKNTLFFTITIFLVHSCNSGYKENFHFSKTKSAGSYTQSEIEIPIPEIKLRTIENCDQEVSEEKRDEHIAHIYSNFHLVMSDVQEHRKYYAKYSYAESTQNLKKVKSYYQVYLEGVKFEIVCDDQSEIIAILISSGNSIQYLEAYFFDKDLIFHNFERNEPISTGFFLEEAVKWKKEYQKSFFYNGCIIKRMDGVIDHSEKPTYKLKETRYNGLSKETQSILKKAWFYYDLATYILNQKELNCEYLYADYTCDSNHFKIQITKELLVEEDSIPIDPFTETAETPIDEVVQNSSNSLIHGRNCFSEMLKNELLEFVSDKGTTEGFSYVRTIHVKIDTVGNLILLNPKFHTFPGSQNQKNLSINIDSFLKQFLNTYNTWTPAWRTCKRVDSQLQIKVTLIMNKAGNANALIEIRDKKIKGH